MEVSCRPVDVSDADVLGALREQARRAIADQRGGAALLAEIDTNDPDGETMVWCATIDDVVVGYLQAVMVGDPTTVFIREIWVEPAAREVGAGESLLGAALAWAIAEDAECVDAWALPGSRELKNLFERMGLTTRLLTVRRELG
jgi:ribosomal protein S18 acetylase RimI-like enzyme